MYFKSRFVSGCWIQKNVLAKSTKYTDLANIQNKKTVVSLFSSRKEHDKLISLYAYDNVPFDYGFKMRFCMKAELNLKTSLS